MANLRSGPVHRASAVCGPEASGDAAYLFLLSTSAEAVRPSATSTFDRQH